MNVVRPFTFQNDVIEAAKTAIREAFDEKGYPPIEVIVHPTTNIGGNNYIEIMLGGETHQIPIRVRENLAIAFNLTENEGLLNVRDPNNNRE